MATMQQYQATAKGGPFKLANVPVPTLESNEVLIRLRSIGLNPIDWKQLQHGLMVQSWPHVLGVDASGVIDSVGADVSHLKPGDEVMATVMGAYSELAKANARAVYKKPQKLSFDEAASLPLGFVTALSAVYGDPGLKVPMPFLPGSDASGAGKFKSVLVLGGASVCGASAIQLLRLGLGSDGVILTTASPTHHGKMKELGATQAFDRNSKSLNDEVKSASNGGVDVILDAVGLGAADSTIFEMLKEDGPKEYSMIWTGPDAEVPQGVTKHGIYGRAVFARPGVADGVGPAFTNLLEEGKFKLPVQVERAGNGFEAIPAALEQLKAGVSGKKLVIGLD